jgi:hypothetical protein
MGAYGSAVANVSRCSMQRNMEFNASVHTSVHTPGPFGVNSYSMGLTISLKLGTNGDAQSSLPIIDYNSYNVDGSSAPTQFLRLFLASLYEPRHTSTPTMVTLGCKN